MILEAYSPHCDPRILHAPDECRFCDEFPELQELRERWSINFTGKHEKEKVPCPADALRGDRHKRWPGNRAEGYLNEKENE